MAKKQVRKYVFTPGVANAGTITIPGMWSQEKFLLITNITKGAILFNFADAATGLYNVVFKPGGIPSSLTDTSKAVYNDAAPLGYSSSNLAKIQNVESGYGETTITLKIDTSSMSSTDHLSILVEDVYQYVRPWSDFGTDAIERGRVSLGQSMIDADFEYGLQPTKWQGFQTVGNYPSIYEAVTPDLVVGNLVSSGNAQSLITGYSVSHGLNVGDPITVSQLNIAVNGFGKAEGGSLIFAANTNFFTYFAKGQVGGQDGTNLTTTRSQLRKGGFYSGADLPVTTVSTDASSPSTITVTFATPHGFYPGMPILVNANPTSSTLGADTLMQYLSGPYYANLIANANTISFSARGLVATGGAGFNGSGLTGNYGNLMVSNPYGIKIYARPDGFFTHRPGDGGVILGTASPLHGVAAVRQSKKYFRYQSGKGFLYTTGVLFAPNYDITSISASQTSLPMTITATTSIPHGLQAGAKVRVAGVATSGYDGSYTVKTTVDEYTITMDGIQNVDDTNGVVGNVPKLFMYQWHGSCIRTGPHDDANGMFFEYDGLYFNVIKRSSNLQLAGTVTFTPNSNRVVGEPDRNNNPSTLFQTQLKIGDKVVIKGMVHRVSAVISNSEIAIAPDFRGTTASSGNLMFKVLEQRASQPNFNRDTVLGTGDANNPSGYLMDPNKMQMVGIQFTWYGAGFMDYMVRGYDGNFIILHRFKQNNLNNTSSMRSANLPVRYQVINEAGQGVTDISPIRTGGLGINDTSLQVTDASFFPDSGYITVENEIIYYNGRDTSGGIGNHILNNLIRGTNYSTFVGGVQKTFYGTAKASHLVRTGVELISQTATPTMSHWGSSYIIDGGFDFDRGYQFTYTVTNANVTTAGNTIMGLRLSPSASNSITGDLGTQELLNRAQILLQNIKLTCGDQRTQGNVAVLVTGYLNPSNYNEATQTWNALNNNTYGNEPSFSQVTNAPAFTSGTVAAPGEKLFEFVYDIRATEVQDLTNVKDLSQSGIGGRGTFPNGSDSLYITLTALPGQVGVGNTFVSNVHVTIQWSEAQA